MINLAKQIVSLKNECKVADVWIGKLSCDYIVSSHILINTVFTKSLCCEMKPTVKLILAPECV